MIPHVKLLKKQQVLMGNAPLCAPSGGLDFQFGTKYTIGKHKSISRPCSQANLRAAWKKIEKILVTVPFFT